MFLLIVFALIALVFSFACSVFEAVLLSVTPAYIGTQERHGSARARRTGELLRRLKRNVDRPLSAILSLNTIAHTVGAAGVGAQAQRLFGNAAVTAASVVMTLLILVLSEIIPKTLGAVHWRALAPLVARAVVVLIWVLYPFVLLSRVITAVIARRGRADDVSREELGALAEVGARAGVIERDEGRMIQNLLRLTSIQTRDIMTPRSLMLTLPATLDVWEAVERVGSRGFSRIPLTATDSKDITGYVLRTDLLLAAANDDADRPAQELARRLISVDGSLSIAELFERLLDAREQIALVREESGGVAGLVTFEDILETVLGAEIVDETDSQEDLRTLARNRWRKRARIHGLMVDEPHAAE